jgi:hypothetical protein
MLEAIYAWRGNGGMGVAKGLRDRTPSWISARLRGTRIYEPPYPIYDTFVYTPRPNIVLPFLLSVLHTHTTTPSTLVRISLHFQSGGPTERSSNRSPFAKEASGVNIIFGQMHLQHFRYPSSEGRYLLHSHSAFPPGVTGIPFA